MGLTGLGPLVSVGADRLGGFEFDQLLKDERKRLDVLLVLSPGTR